MASLWIFMWTIKDYFFKSQDYFYSLTCNDTDFLGKSYSIFFLHLIYFLLFYHILWEPHEVRDWDGVMRLKQHKFHSCKNKCWRSNVQHGSVQFSCSVVSNSLQPHRLQHARPPCPSPTPEAYPNSCPLSRWCHPTRSSSVGPFSSCPQSFPASKSFQMNQSFTSGGQSTGLSASTSALPMNIQDSFPLGWTGWISLQSKGLSRVFSNTTVQKHQFFSAKLSL